MYKKITDEELKECLDQGMLNREIADKFGMSRRVIQIRKARLSKKGLGHGHDVSHLVPDGYAIKGTSTLIDPLGNVKQQWVKTDVDAERQLEIMRAVVDGLCSEIEPLPAVPLSSRKTDKKLLNLYTVSDFHLGMLAWADETGADWDMKIAETLFAKWFDAAFQQALPRALP